MSRFIDADKVMFTDFEIVMCEGDYKKAFKLLCEKLDDAPTEDAEPIRHGHWVIEEYKNSIDGSLYKKYRCSECGCPTAMFIRSPYCSNCGAKMNRE